MSKDELSLKLERIRLLEEKKKLKAGLPHLYGYKMYQWSRLFFESTNRFNFLSAANQIGKSSISIRKAIHWCTEPNLWASLWPGKTPSYFFYLYPSKELASREFSHKWVKEFLPRNEFKDHPQYGWKEEKKNNVIQAVHFNTGCSIIFLSYAMSAEDLQAASPAAIFADEEIPVAIFPELIMRLEATRGYFHLVATPTLGQEFFKEIFEKKRMPEALALTVSMYQCLTYEDGTPGMYSIKDVKERESRLGTQAEIDMRVHGKFSKAEGLKYPSFTTLNCVQPMDSVPSNWLWFSGVDIGSGGLNHPAAICFVAVSPDFKRGRVVECWRGSHLEITTSEDILHKYLFMRGDRKMTGEFYDWSAKDFHTIAMRAGIPMQPAEKGHDLGENLINTLFKNGMLTIDDNETNQDLINELLNNRNDTKKRHAKDDAIDSLRYSVTKIPWDFSAIRGEVKKVIKPVTQVTREEAIKQAEAREQAENDDEINFYNDLMEVF